MTQEEIIEMARQSGLAVGVALDGSKSVGKHEDKSFAVGRLPLEDFVAFAKLVAAKEREACAKVCDWMQEKAEFHGTDCCKFPTPTDCAHVIRARGEA